MADLAGLDLFASSEIVDLIVGPWQHVFRVHAKILEIVPFFKNRMAADLTQSGLQGIKMPDDDPSTVHYILRWLYAYGLSGEFICTDLKWRYRLLTPEDYGYGDCAPAIARIWILANELGAEDLAEDTFKWFQYCLENTSDLAGSGLIDVVQLLYRQPATTIDLRRELMAVVNRRKRAGADSSWARADCAVFIWECIERKYNQFLADFAQERSTLSVCTRGEVENPG